MNAISSISIPLIFVLLFFTPSFISSSILYVGLYVSFTHNYESSNTNNPVLLDIEGERMMLMTEMLGKILADL
jgi:hypothetical protein